MPVSAAGGPPGLYAHDHPCQLTEIAHVGGADAHAYLWVTVLPFLIIASILVLRAGLGRVSFLTWPTDRQLLAGAACANLIVVLTAFLTKSGIVSVHPQRLAAFTQLSTVWQWAAYIALALAAAAAAVRPLSQRHVRLGPTAQFPRCSLGLGDLGFPVLLRVRPPLGQVFRRVTVDELSSRCRLIICCFEDLGRGAIDAAFADLQSASFVPDVCQGPALTVSRQVSG